MNFLKTSSFHLIILFMIQVQIIAQVVDENFKPHMVIHINKGCPQNSSCTKVMGELQQKWEEAIATKSQKNVRNFIKEHGAPLSLWTTEKESIDTITFDSRCKNHRKKDSIIYEALRFTKAPVNFRKSSNDLPNLAIIKKGKDHKVFVVPRKSLPLAINKDKLQYLQDVNGTYYTLSIGQESLDISFELPQSKEILSSKCPQSIIKKFESMNINKDLFQGVYCKEIWDLSKKAYVTMGFGWSC